MASAFKRSKRVPVLLGWLVLLVGAFMLAIHRQFLPPAFLPAEGRLDELRVGGAQAWMVAPPRFPAGTIPIEIEQGKGWKLRGLWVPAESSAPVVVHFLESGASPWYVDRSLLARQLRDVGYSSLFVDYSGVGMSEGLRTTENLGDDVKAIWREAMKRVEGEHKRIVLRGVSIGTIAVSILLVDGASPSGAVLIAPVLRDTVVPNAARQLYGQGAFYIAKWIYLPLADCDIMDVADRGGFELLTYAGEDDSFTSRRERKKIRQITESIGGKYVHQEGTHFQTVGRSGHVDVEELEKLLEWRIVPPPVPQQAQIQAILSVVPDKARARFSHVGVSRIRDALRYSQQTSPIAIAAAALTHDDPLVGARLRWAAPDHMTLEGEKGIPDSVGAWEFEPLACLFDMSDPAGDLKFEIIEAIWIEAKLRGQYPISSLAGIALTVEMHGEGTSWSSVWRSLASSGMSSHDVDRQFTRLMLKAQGIPDRVRTGANGRPYLEVYRGGDIWSLFGRRR